MHRWGFIIWLSLLGWIVAGCALALPGAAPAQTTPVVLTETPLATPSDLASAPLTATHWLSFTTSTEDLTIAHPESWQVMQPGVDDLTSYLTALEDQAIEDLTPILEMLKASSDNLAAFIALGILPTAQNYTANFTVMRFPAQPLSLPAYTRLLSQQLKTLPYIQVKSATVEAGLRPQGLEIASIRYTVDGALYGQPDLQLEGWQVALLDPPAHNLIVLTFTVPAAEFEAMQETLRELIFRIQF